MDLASLIYRGLYDCLATIDISGGVLLAAIRLQTGYVALFRAIHGPEAGRAPAAAGRTPVQPAPAGSAPAESESPWARR